MINEPLLWKTLEHVEQHPEEWYQKAWLSMGACGTRYCFAGWAAVLDGADIETLDVSFGPPHPGHVSEYARLALGLSPDEARWLFDMSNSLEDLRHLVERLAASNTDA